MEGRVWVGVAESDSASGRGSIGASLRVEIFNPAMHSMIRSMIRGLRWVAVIVAEGCCRHCPSFATAAGNCFSRIVDHFPGIRCAPTAMFYGFESITRSKGCGAKSDEESISSLS